jgi:hypothetical protein
MLSHVTERLLRDTIQFVFNFFGQPVRSSSEVKRTLNSTVTRKSFGKLVECIGQTRPFERLWPQTEQHSASVFQTGFGELSDTCQTLGRIHGFIRTPGRLNVQQNSRELLNERIVDLASQTVAFLYYGRARESLHKTLIARLKAQAPGGLIERLEAFIDFTNSRHLEFAALSV